MRNINWEETNFDRDPDLHGNLDHKITELKKKAAIGKCAGHSFSEKAEEYMVDAVLMGIQQLVNQFTSAALHGTPVLEPKKAAFNFHAGNGVQWMNVSKETGERISQQLEQIKADCNANGVPVELRFVNGNTNFILQTKTPARVMYDFSENPVKFVPRHSRQPE